MIAGATYVRVEPHEKTQLGVDRVILFERRQTGERQRRVTHWKIKHAGGYPEIVEFLAPNEQGVVDHVERVTEYVFEWVYLGEYDDRLEWFTMEQDALIDALDQSYEQQRATTLEDALSTLD